MVLEPDVALDLSAEPGDMFELAVSHRGLESLAAAVVFQHLFAVEPVLRVASFGENSRLIDFARWLD